jgi:hypothetical protein
MIELMASKPRHQMGSDCSFVKRSAFRSENHGSFGYDFKNRGPVSQQEWHVKEPSLLKAISAVLRSKFAALSVTTAAGELKNGSGG